MKKLNLLFTALLLLFSLTATAHEFEVDGIYYNILSEEDKTVEVTYRGTSYSQYSNEYYDNVVIPESVIYNGSTYNVTSIGSSAFYGCPDLTSIEIPNSVTSIGASAFYNCTGITNFEIPNSVTSIGGSAFYNTTWYNNLPNGVVYIGKVLYKYKGTMPANTSIVVKDGTLSIGEKAFYECSGLTSIVIPNSVSSIGNKAFQNCKNLANIEIPNSITSIEDETFYKCSALTSIVIPNSITSIGASAFYYCTALTSIVIPDGVTSIGDNAFYNTAWYNNLSDGVVYAGKVLYKYKGKMPANTSIVVKDGTLSIACYAFKDCSRLKSIEIPNSVTSIGEYAFYNCYELTVIVIPNSVTNIGNRAFNGCSELKTVINFSNLTFRKGSSDYGYIAYYANKVINAPNGFIDGDFVWFENEDGMTLAGYLGDATELILPADYKGKSVTSIGTYAFRDCTSLTSIVIPNSVTSIGDYAFDGCTSLKDLRIEDVEGTLSLGNYIFDDSPLETLYLGRNLSYDMRYNSPFYNKTTLKNFIIGNSVTSIGNSMFENCTSLKDLRIEDGEGTLSLGNYIFDDSPLETLYLGRNLSYSSHTPGQTVHSPFDGKKTLISITIGDSVTSIGSDAFKSCSGLTSIEIPNSVTSIGYAAFEYCSGLTSIEIGNSVTSIGNYAFKGCTSLTSFEIPNSVTSIGGWAFEGCRSLTSIEIGNSVISIGDYAFHCCTGLTSIEIPNSVTSIGIYAFRDCSSLTSVIIGNGVVSIGGDAFNGCGRLKTVINLSSLTFSKGSISNGLVAYYADNVINAPNGYIDGDYVWGEIDGEKILAGYMGDAEDLTLPTNCNGENYAVGESAFYGNTTITNIVIPNNVTRIGDSAFYSCTNLASIEIPNSVTSIGEFAFRGCYSLTSIEIPNSVTNVGMYAFYECSGLTNVVISDNVTRIEEGLFRGCSALTSIEIPNSVTSIRFYAFEYCTALTSVVIGNGVTSIENKAFSDCSGLTSVVVGDGVRYIGYDVFSDCTALTNIVIPGNVSSIGGRAFYGCSGLANVVIGNSVASIGDYAFSGCSVLKTVINLSRLTLSKGSTDYGLVAYYADNVINAPNGYVDGDYVWAIVSEENTLCRYLGNEKELVLPGSCNGENYAIGNSAFYNCIGLTSIEIPNSVTSIGNYAFKGCTGLKEVHINDLSAWCGINFGSNDANPLYYARNLYLNGEMVTDLEIPDGVTSIENYAFINCTGLTNVVVSDGIDVIGESAFSGCSNVETVYISNTIYSIGNNAFAGCNKIYDIKVGAKKPIGGNENIFASTVYDNATLYIPGGTKSLYEKRVPWNKFFYIKEMDFTGIDELKGEDVKLKGVCYDLSGRAVENPTNGIYIIDGKKVMVK